MLMCRKKTVFHYFVVRTSAVTELKNRLRYLRRIVCSAKITSVSLCDASRHGAFLEIMQHKTCGMNEITCVNKVSLFKADRTRRLCWAETKQPNKLRLTASAHNSVPIGPRSVSGWHDVLRWINSMQLHQESVPYSSNDLGSLSSAPHRTSSGPCQGGPPGRGANR